MKRSKGTDIPNYPIPIIDSDEKFTPGFHPVKKHDEKDYSKAWWQQLTPPSIGYVLIISEEWHDKEEAKRRAKRTGANKDRKASDDLDGAKEPIAYMIFGSLNMFQKAYYSLYDGDTFWNNVLPPSENWYRVIAYYMTKNHQRHQYNEGSRYSPFYFKMTERGSKNVTENAI